MKKQRISAEKGKSLYALHAMQVQGSHRTGVQLCMLHHYGSE